jgi:hypothetical protein
MAKKAYTWVEQAVVISAMRRVFRRYPHYKTVRNRCKREWLSPCKNGNQRRRVSFECETCHLVVNAKDFCVDHTDPVVDVISGFAGYDIYAKRLFCSLDNLSGMCKTCHTAKSASEAKQRKRSRDDKKNRT